MVLALPRVLAHRLAKAAASSSRCWWPGLGGQPTSSTLSARALASSRSPSRSWARRTSGPAAAADRRLLWRGHRGSAAAPPGRAAAGRRAGRRPRLGVVAAPGQLPADPAATSAAPSSTPSTPCRCGAASTASAPAAPATLRTVWREDEPLPTAAHPGSRVILVPRRRRLRGLVRAAGRAGSTAAGSAGTGLGVPVRQAAQAPGPGDNQALAVNTTDDTAVYDVAFAMVWADGSETATNTNEAYALASCSDCAAVAGRLPGGVRGRRQPRGGSAERLGCGQLQLRQLPDLRAGRTALRDPRPTRSAPTPRPRDQRLWAGDRRLRRATSATSRWPRSRGGSTTTSSRSWRSSRPTSS